MILSDAHTHSHLSSDGSHPMEDMAMGAMEKGLTELTLTDHMDLHFPDRYSLPFTFDPQEYFKEYEATRVKVQGKLTLYAGIETGLQDGIWNELSLLLYHYPWDYVIGSVHLIHGLDPYYPEFWAGKSVQETLHEYFATTYRLIQSWDNFDALGHLDYVIRYAPGGFSSSFSPETLSLIDDIFRYLIKTRKCLEVNTAGYKHGLSGPNPSAFLFKRYQSLCGTLLTLGSDAHRPEDLAMEFAQTEKLLLSCGFSSYQVFSKRVPQKRLLGEA